MNPRVLNALLMGLNQDEVTELQQLVTYLGEKAGPSNPSGHMPEGSVASLINRASPKVRAKMAMISDMVEYPRTKPFEEKWGEDEYFSRLGMDVPASLKVKEALDGQEVMGKLQQRMGTDADMPQKELSRREVIAAALENLK